MDTTNLCLSNFVWWYAALNSAFWYQCRWLRSSFKVTVVWKIKKPLGSFSHKFLNQFWWNLVCCHNLLVCWSPCFIYSTQLVVRGENFTCMIYLKCTFCTGLCYYTCEPISFKLSLITDMTMLYFMSPVWMTFTFTDDHRVTRKLQLVQSFCCKVAWSDPFQLFAMADYVKVMTSKSPLSMANMDHVTICYSCLRQKECAQMFLKTVPINTYAQCTYLSDCK